MAVTCIVKTVYEQFLSPFQFTSSHIQKLQNVVSGAIVADEFCDDILNAHSIGKQSGTEFVMDRIQDRFHQETKMRN